MQSTNMTDEELFDAFLEQLDNIEGWANKLYGKGSDVSRRCNELYHFADKKAKEWLESSWNTTEAEEYRQAHLPELARMARAHNESRRHHG